VEFGYGGAVAEAVPRLKAGLDKGRKPEKARFRAAGVAQAIALGRTEAQAAMETSREEARSGPTTRRFTFGLANFRNRGSVVLSEV
jgi:hypothetical protein